MVRFLHTKLADKVNQVKELEKQLKAAYSKQQIADDREEFLLNELAAQVSELDCKFVICSGCLLDSWSLFLIFYVQLSWKILLKNIDSLKKNSRD